MSDKSFYRAFIYRLDMKVVFSKSGLAVSVPKNAIFLGIIQAMRISKPSMFSGGIRRF